VAAHPTWVAWTSRRSSSKYSTTATRGGPSNGAAPCCVAHRRVGRCASAATIGNDRGMKLSEHSESDATVDEVFAARCDKSVREQACKESGALSWAVSIEPSADGGARIQVDRAMPPEVPDFIRRFLGDTIDIRQVEEWAAPDSSGTRTAAVKLTIKGQPASMVATATVSPTATGSTETVDGDVTVNVPFLGKKIEPEIAKVIASAIRIERRVCLEWIEAHR
jgi:hypothetical protein